jgi:hypothetical protein
MFSSWKQKSEINLNNLSLLIRRYNLFQKLLKHLSNSYTFILYLTVSKLGLVGCDTCLPVRRSQKFWRNTLPNKQPTRKNKYQEMHSLRLLGQREPRKQRGHPQIHIWVFIKRTNLLMLFKQLITVYCENDVKQINTLCAQNGELF